VIKGFTAEFEEFFAEAEPRLRRALVAALGAERGREALAEAMAWAWEHWERVRAMTNPAGYLYRVGRSRTRGRRAHVLFPVAATGTTPWVEPALIPALVALSEQQRVVLVLVHGYGWSQREVADLLDVSPSTVQKHLERALTHVRAALEVGSDA
jgi:DNA-directed RNA polymerase specialized sigma24 family protein